MMAHKVRLLLVSCILVAANYSLAAEYPDAERFRGAIDNFIAAEAGTPVATGGIVATGSSSMRGWHDRIASDLAPLSVIPRGFGGSNMYDVRYFLDELVLRHKPRAVMIYEGDNDAALGASPEQVLLHLKAIVEEIQATLPGTRIYVLAVKPSIARWNIWPTMVEINRQMQALCDGSAGLTYIDVAGPMLDSTGVPRADIFLADNLHMNAKGYDIWREAVRPVLLAGEQGTRK